MINIQNIDDNECFKWCLVKYLNPADLNPATITKADKDFEKSLDFKDIKFSVNIRYIHKTEKKNFIFGYKTNEKYPIYLPKNCFEKKIY